MTSYGGQGFEEFVHAEFPRLWRLGRVLSGHDDDAWDLAQEALVKVGLHWARIDRNGNPGAYARTCLVRLHIAGIRRRRRETPMEPAQFEHAAPEGLETDAVDRRPGRSTARPAPAAATRRDDPVLPRRPLRPRHRDHPALQ